MAVLRNVTGSYEKSFFRRGVISNIARLICVNSTNGVAVIHGSLYLASLFFLSYTDGTVSEGFILIRLRH